MNENKKSFDEIPADACILKSGEFELGDNGENSKSAPIRLVARSGKPIEHWFWGRVVHDLSGMQLHKSRIPIDYVHDDKEVIGYLNKFDTESGDLVTSGALVPFKETDRATEIIHKNKAGVPYEASINFGGDGIKIQQVLKNERAAVNGYDFEGPGIIIREWPLRGVAICPYGADSNTESSVFATNKVKTFKASVFAEAKTVMKEKEMSEKSVEVTAKANETKGEKENLFKNKAVEAKPEEVKPEVNKMTVEGEAVESDEAKAKKVKPEEIKLEAQAPVVPSGEEAKPEVPAAVLSREEFIKIKTEFGDSIAAKIMCDGGDYNTALKMAYETAKAEAAAMKSKIDELSATGKGQPVKMVEAAKKEKSKLFNTGK